MQAPDWLYSLFGATPPARMVHTPTSTEWPSADDVAQARAVDATYGTPVAGFVTGTGGRMPQYGTAREAMRAVNDDQWGDRTSQVLPSEQDMLLTNWLAAQRSPVASLGFDPRRMALQRANGQDLTMAGAYDPQSDRIWTNPATSKANPVHESMHRGLEMLRQTLGAGAVDTLLQDAAVKEETLVRALMQKYLSDVERNPFVGKEGLRQQQAGKEVLPLLERRGTIDKIEALAQQEIARRTPRGPR